MNLQRWQIYSSIIPITSLYHTIEKEEKTNVLEWTGLDWIRWTRRVRQVNERARSIQTSPSTSRHKDLTNVSTRPWSTLTLTCGFHRAPLLRANIQHLLLHFDLFSFSVLFSPHGLQFHRNSILLFYSALETSQCAFTVPWDTKWGGKLKTQPTGRRSSKLLFFVLFPQMKVVLSKTIWLPSDCLEPPLIKRSRPWTEDTRTNWNWKSLPSIFYNDCIRAHTSLSLSPAKLAVYNTLHMSPPTQQHDVPLTSFASRAAVYQAVTSARLIQHSSSRHRKTQ